MMDQNLIEDIYNSTILYHCRYPRNTEKLDKPSTHSIASNPFCGDDISFQILFHHGYVSRVGSQSNGCAINNASASILGETICGKSIEQLDLLASRFKILMSGGHVPNKHMELLGDLKDLVGVRRAPVRVKCALLAISALEDALELYCEGAS